MDEELERLRRFESFRIRLIELYNKHNPEVREVVDMRFFGRTGGSGIGMWMGRNMWRLESGSPPWVVGLCLGCGAEGKVAVARACLCTVFLRLMFF